MARVCSGSRYPCGWMVLWGLLQGSSNLSQSLSRDQSQAKSQENYNWPLEVLSFSAVLITIWLQQRIWSVA